MNDEQEPGDDPIDHFDQFSGTDAAMAMAGGEDITDALLGAVGFGDAADEFGQVIDIGDRYLAMVTDGIGAKLHVANAMGEYSTVGTDVVAKTVNRLLAEGFTPVAYTNALTVDREDEEIAYQIGSGLAEGAEQAGILLLRGTMRVEPEAVAGVDLLGTAAGVADRKEAFPGDAATGDRLVGFPSSGIHANGHEAVAEAMGEEVDYSDPFPENESRSIGETLLQPTRLYTYLTDALRDGTVHGAVPVADGGWTKLLGMGEFQYSITDPFEPPAVFRWIREVTGLERDEMYRTFNMGTGFVVAAPESSAKEIAAATDGQIIGVVEQGSGVAIQGMDVC